MTTADGKKASKSFQVEVDPSEVKHDVVRKVINASCAGNDGSIVLKVNGEAGPYTYKWDHGANGPKLESIGQGKYRVTITDKHGCFMRAVYTINQTPGLAKPVITQSADTLMVAQQASHYQWYKDGAVMEAANQYYLVFQEAGTYSVEISNDQSCSASSDYYHVEEPAMSIAHSAKSFFVLSHFNYYPNPAVDQLNVEVAVNQPAVTSITIYDFKGQVMMSQDLGVVNSTITTQLPVDQYPAGIYLIRIKAGDEVLTRRFVKR